MDSKYSMIGTNRPTLPKFQIKSKPSPIVFPSSSSPKKIKLTEAEEKPKPKNGPTILHSNLQMQRRNLPIFVVRSRLLEEIAKNQTLIIIGETGSGKTTQIPQFIYSSRLQNDGVIGITQPRRVAAISIALRVAQEIGTQIGETVGYTVRFEDITKPRTKIKYLTDGMLLREAINDPLLIKYSFIVLDEAHERTVHTDVLFGIVKEAQKIRKEKNLNSLNIIIMSATMDVDHFSKYFNDCQTIYVEGRIYPIDVFHSVKTQDDYQFSCLTTLFKLHRDVPAQHGVLIFLTGQEEIESMVSSIHSLLKDPEMTTYPYMRVFPLYAALPSEQQLEVFKPTSDNCRKVILSTNIAETSLTINGIDYVIDSGMVKARAFHPSTGLDSLKVQKISKAQAWQRTGRAGREAKGYCYRMFTKEDFQQMKEMTTPEILRCNLSNVCLQLLALNIHAMHFDFMDKPPVEYVENAFKELKYLGAIESIKDGKLTLLGKKMVKFPLDPRFSKLIISAKDFNCLEEMLSIVSLLSSESVYVTPSKKREQAIAARQKFMSPYGDHLTLLNIYKGFNNAGQKSKFCYENFLNFRNLLYAKEVRSQLVSVCKSCDIPVSSCGTDFDQIRKCLITGLFMNIAELQRNVVNGTHYITLESKQVVSIHPGSILHGQQPHCVLFTEVVQTTNCYLRYLTVIDANWLYDIIPDYVRTHNITITTGF